MKTKELNKKAYQYILECIDSEAYEVKAETDKEKLAFLYNTFVSEYWHEYNQRYYKSMHKAFENWLMGLPSVFHVDFENYRILEIAVEWGSLPKDSSEAKQDKILSNWFNFITIKTFQLFKKHNIN